jgi:hypothetical protein
MPYEVRAKAGDSAFSVVAETAKQALAKVCHSLMIPSLLRPKTCRIDSADSVKSWAFR